MIGNKKYLYLYLEDMEHILRHTQPLWELMRKKSLFVTGGTGFFGKWLLESFAYCNSRLSLGAKAIILSRNPEKFLTEHAYFNQECIRFIKGTITEFEYPKEPINYIIHAAVESGNASDIDGSLRLFQSIVDGTRNVLELAKEKCVESFLFTSSGAVYGRQPSEVIHVSEEYIGAPDCTKLGSIYGEGKRAAELLCTIYYYQYNIPVKIARCFAFVGPHLPLQSNYAIGNFIYDALMGNTIIRIQGDGTPMRSYLYSSDLMICLWNILLKGENISPYNVGSDIDISILALAEKVRDIINPSCSISVQNKISNRKVERYVPSVDKIRDKLNIIPVVSLNDAIFKTAMWYKLRL